MPSGSPQYYPESSPNGSPGASQSSKKKKKVKALTLDEVFNQVSTLTATNANAAPAPVVLTPRSAEVCLKLGVNPEVLKIRDIDSFWEGGIDPTVQRMRHEAYVQRRYEMVKQCRFERKKLINGQLDSQAFYAADDTMSPEMILEKQRQQTSTLIEMELKRIEKMQKRQEKELEQMIQYEVTRAQLQQEMDRKIEDAKKKEAFRKKQLQKRMKLMAEERRLKELQKMAMQEAEEQNRRLLAKEMHEREAAFAEQKAREEEQERQRRREEEMERARKHEEHKAQVQKFFEDEQLRIRKRLEQMQDAEKKKQEAIARKQMEHAEALRIKRDEVEQRIERNLEMAKEAEQKRKDDFLNKQAAFEAVRAEHLRKQEEERQLHAQELMLQEQRRRMILLQQQREEEMKKELMLQKFEEEEHHVEEVEEVRDRELQLQKEKKKIRTQMKLENVERVFRANEYKRMEVLKQIENNDSRTKAMLDQKKSLIDERRKTAATTRLQKEQIARVMEEVRSNANKAQKLITQAMSGKVTLASLTAKSTGSPSASPAKRPSSTGGSGSKKVNNRMKSSQTTSALLNMGGTKNYAATTSEELNATGGGAQSLGRSKSANNNGFNATDESGMDYTNVASSEVPKKKYAFMTEEGLAGAGGTGMQSANDNAAYISPYATNV